MNVSLLAGFLLRAILWLLICLGAWYALGRFLAMPVAWLTTAVVHGFFPDWAEGVELSGTTLSLLTTLEMPPLPGASANATALLSPEADYRVIGYGLPMLLAMLLASRPRGMAIKMLIGALALLPFQIWSLCFTWLKQVAIQAGPAVAAQAQFSESARNLIALAYQFGILVLPPMIPVILWLLMDRRFFSTLLVEAYLERAEPEDKAP